VRRVWLSVGCVGWSEVVPAFEGGVPVAGSLLESTVHVLGEACWCEPRWGRSLVAGDDRDRVLLHFDRLERN
jgi:hypothetical protein